MFTNFCFFNVETTLRYGVVSEDEGRSQQLSLSQKLASKSDDSQPRDSDVQSSAPSCCSAGDDLQEPATKSNLNLMDNSEVEDNNGESEGQGAPSCCASKESTLRAYLSHAAGFIEMYQTATLDCVFILRCLASLFCQEL
jgi:hypothetical protein